MLTGFGQDALRTRQFAGFLTIGKSFWCSGTLGFDPQSLELRVQRGQPDLEPGRGRGQCTAALRNHPADVVALGPFSDLLQGLRRAGLSSVDDVWLEQRGVEQFVVLHEECDPFHLLLELTDVAGPVEADQSVDRGARDSSGANPALLRGADEEVSRQVGNVGPPLAERRERHHPVGDPMVEVTSESPLRKERFNVAVRRRDDPNVCGMRDVTAEPVHLALLENPQDPRLGFQRHVADLVQKEGAPVGGLELAGSRLDARGDPLFDAEQLRLDEVPRKRGAVQRDQR